MSNGSFCEKEREILWKLIYRISRDEITKSYGISNKEVLRLKKKLEVELSRLADAPVKGEVESCPLLFYAEE